jgi:DNA (cytosine-5)-methyltransferase 1
LTTKQSFTYVSLFSGVGGFEQALNKLGGKCVMASEIDKWANLAYETLYGHKTVGDITKVKAEDVPNHDLLVGGFPCQAFSVAGKRLGFEDTRGTLFFEIARIAKVKRPKAMLLENVKGLVSHDKGKTLDTIIQTLNDIGYTVDFEVLNSKYFGVPQNRERIFIIAIRDDLIAPEPWNIGKRTDVVAKGKRRISQLDGVKTFNFDWPPQTEVTTRLRDILEDNVDEKYYLSEEKTAKLVAQLVEKEVIAEMDRQREISELEDDPYEEDIEPQMLGLLDIKGQENIRRVDATTGISPTLTTMGGGHREPKIAVEYNRKTGIGKELDVAHTVNHSDWRGLNRNQTQNAVLEEIRPVLTPDRENKRQNGRRFKEDGEESFTLTAQDRHGVAIGTPPRYRIRKLTPRECFRLQGFPDSEFDRLVSAGISNSQLYKMAGNAVTVNVIEAISERLIPLITEVDVE